MGREPWHLGEVLGGQEVVWRRGEIKIGSFTAAAVGSVRQRRQSRVWRDVEGMAPLFRTGREPVMLEGRRWSIVDHAHPPFLRSDALQR